MGYERMQVRNWYVRGLINLIHVAKELAARPAVSIPAEQRQLMAMVKLTATIKDQDLTSNAATGAFNGLA